MILVYCGRRRDGKRLARMASGSSQLWTLTCFRSVSESPALGQVACRDLSVPVVDTWTCSLRGAGGGNESTRGAFRPASLIGQGLGKGGNSWVPKGGKEHISECGGWLNSHAGDRMKCDSRLDLRVGPQPVLLRVRIRQSADLERSESSSCFR